MVLVSAASVLPHSPGVYRFRSGGRVLYIGRATDLRSRVRSYAGSLRDRRHLQAMVGQVTSVEAVACASVHEAAWLERNLLEQSLPRWNRVRGGAEVPCWVAVDPRPGSAVVALVTSQPTTGWWFGPYLGTERAALVVSGIRRVAPIHLTRTGLSAWERELAGSYGVAAADRERLLTQIRATLTREPTAVNRTVDDLLGRRARAVEMQAYEMAGAITLELDALGWATSPQRVTGDLPDATVAGYADGLLVTLTVRAGRLGSWTVRRSDPRRSAALVGDTPPQWREFADSAAALAAVLSECR